MVRGRINRTLAVHHLVSHVSCSRYAQTNGSAKGMELMVRSDRQVKPKSCGLLKKRKASRRVCGPPERTVPIRFNLQTSFMT